MIDRGNGIPVVLVPGIQGRWEWTAPTVEALARRCRVITFSLCDEPTSGFPFDADAGFNAYVQQIDAALQRAHIQKAIVIGVSYGGLIATEFAVRHRDRVLGLVLASALPPGWTPNARARFYMRAPRLLMPLFVVASPLRMFPEVRSALALKKGVPFMIGHGYRVVRAAPSPVRMARRAEWTEQHRFCDLSELQVPTLVITGEDRLDRIVAPELTREYLARWPHARHATLQRTGHIGLVTKPEEFAELVGRFAADLDTDAEPISA
jgi:pimeloyl-ACP methyl ester carboxylesterase